MPNFGGMLLANGKAVTLPPAAPAAPAPAPAPAPMPAASPPSPAPPITDVVLISSAAKTPAPKPAQTIARAPTVGTQQSPTVVASAPAVPATATTPVAPAPAVGTQIGAGAPAGVTTTVTAPEPTAILTSATFGNKLDFAQLESVWVLAGGPQDVASIAAAVALAESSGDNTKVYNTAYPDRPGYTPPLPGNSPEYSEGFWQINVYAHPQFKDQVTTPIGNAEAAVSLYTSNHGFTPWSTYNDQAYLRFLPGGAAPVGGVTAQSAIGSGSSTAGRAPAPVNSDWKHLLGVFSSNVPKAHTRMAASGDTLLAVMGVAGSSTQTVPAPPAGSEAIF